MATTALYTASRARAAATRVPPWESQGGGIPLSHSDRIASAANARRLAARRRQATRFTALGIALVLLLYIWVITAGWMTYWPQYSSHYNRLAEAFRRGQCSLLFRPDPAHLALPDPYDPVANHPYRCRPGVHDVVLFNGKFYFYWGPVPALLLVGVKLFTGVRAIGDQYLVFAFAAGSLLFGALLLRNLWGRFFPDVPPWMLLLGVLVAGLATPMPYTLARAAVYEAAILGGQCFLLAGLYFACAAKADRSTTARSPGRLRLALAGTCWALAAGSRVSLAIAIAALALLVVWRILRDGAPTRRRLLSKLAAFTLPLAAGAGALAGYNCIRFGHPSEFGQRFQLTNNANYNSTPHLFQVANAVPGMYSYLFRPLAVHLRFPFVDAKAGAGTFPHFIRLPEHYEYNETIAGLLLVTPFVWLAVFPLARLPGAPWARRRGLKGSEKSSMDESDHPVYGKYPCSEHSRVAAGPKARSSNRDQASPKPDDPGNLNWVLLCLVCAAVLGFAPIPFMLGSTMRYLCDLTPCLMILAAVGFWQRSRITAARGRRAHGMFVTVAGGLAGWSLAIGLLLGVSGYYKHFRHFHRHLFGDISYWAHEPSDAAADEY